MRTPTVIVLTLATLMGSGLTNGGLAIAQSSALEPKASHPPTATAEMPTTLTKALVGKARCLSHKKISSCETGKMAVAEIDTKYPSTIKNQTVETASAQAQPADAGCKIIDPSSVRAGGLGLCSREFYSPRLGGLIENNVETVTIAAKKALPKDFKSAIATPAQNIASPIPSLSSSQSAQPFNSSAQELGGSVQMSIDEGAIAQDVIAQDVEGAYVREVQVRFVNSKGEAVDKQGNPIQGRISEDFIRSEIQLKAGDNYSQEAVRRDLQQLRQLALFSKVTVSTVQVGTDVDVIYNVTEGQPRSFNFGGGYSDDLGVFVILGVRQIIGRSQRVSVLFQPSLRDFEYDLRFTSPYLASENRLGYSFGTFRDRRSSDIFDKDVNLPDDNKVREIRMGGNVNFTRPIGDWQGTLGLNYTSISTRDRNLRIARRDEEGNPLTLSGTGVDELYTVSLAFTRDWRNNPFNPTSGSILTLSTEQSIPLGRGNITMNRLLANYIQYVPIQLIGRGDPQALPEMFAFNLQAGTIVGDFPPTEAFRLGGSSSVRAYTSGALGTGRSYVLASGEYRFPIRSNIGGVIFVDFASDLGSGDSVLGEPAIVRDKPGTGAGAGVGVRVRSPFGLIRFDIGVSDRGGVRFLLGTGQRF
ncbi:BamA/TamA family outer membrane protein [Kamptonema animale CS-326]|uniref:BamA/OMP85 family outer membrane protein n=1 Tax=Kamptonema animale TaxID=92934 RepID=UPI00232CD1B0|nr:BamA/TamA family outer membrane protein [Kamptonema animale]MDB9509716.1 BamA/TamA family outer membrane protein [Kamptonema animale CS-326]